MNVMNTPVAIAGISTTIGGIVVFVIVKFIMNTSKFGRKELDNVKQEFDELENRLLDYQIDITDGLNKNIAGFEQLKNDCNNQVTIMLEQFEDLQANMIAALKTIPNKKVQAVVEEYESQYQVKKQEIIEKTIYTNDYVDNKLNELRQDVEKMLNEAKERINSETETA